jgi:glycosyltransferase involved in cell wall biosynthesis
MPSVGIVAIDRGWKWTGGRYYLHHLINSVAALPSEESIELHDVWWGDIPDDDPFAEVRNILGKPVVVSPPTSYWKRVLRKVKRTLHRSRGASDLFEPYGIDVFFPIPPCDNAGIPYVFWLPDFQYLRRPDLMSEKLCRQLEKYYYEHVHSASRVVLSSEDAKSDFANVYPERLDRTHVLHFCSVPDDDWWKLIPSSVVKKYRLPERFFIVCNQFTRHKNHMTLLRAMHILSEREWSDIHLVCTGSTFDHRQENCIGQVKDYLSEHNLEAQVHILGLVPRSEQIALLRQSIAVLQPSWFEGWSTIIEDAKTLGKPVLVSDLQVHHEQLADLQDNFLSLDDAEQWAEAISSAWDNLDAGPSLAQERIGQERLKVTQRECGLSFVQVLGAAIQSRI